MSTALSTLKRHVRRLAGPKPEFRHAETALTLDQTATDRRFVMPFRKTYGYRGDYLNAQHRDLASRTRPDGMIDLGVEGWLLPADALKLYELAYCCGGDCLELGTYRGLSATVMLQASNAAKSGSTILSIDLDPGAKDAGRRTVATMPGQERVFFFNTDADEALATFTAAQRRFAFCFIDHSHRYEHVLTACQALPSVILPSGFCLFHDYNDPRNADPACGDYGVWQGVQDGLDPAQFKFWGVFGCCGLFRKR